MKIILIIIYNHNKVQEGYMNTNTNNKLNYESYN